ELPAEIRASVEAYVGCVGGATTRVDYAGLVRDAGFEDVEITESFTLGDVISPDDPRVRSVLADAGVDYGDDEVRAVLSTITGLAVSARRPGGIPDVEAPSFAGADADGYQALLSYVLSNAAAGEIMAVDNYSDMVSLFDSVDEKLDAVAQAREEGRHIRQLASLGRRIGFDVQQRIIEPEWKAVRSAFRDAVDRGDLAACLVIQDVMVESMAIVTYRSLSGADGIRTDDATARATAAILDDELEHLEVGIARLQAIRDREPVTVERAVIWAHPLVMPQLMSLASTSCESLCDVLSVDCGALDPRLIGADLDLIRARAATQYGDALDRIGIPTDISDALLADLGAMDVGDAAGRVACGPSGCC
ncbi:MAG: long-chain fatty aldehyde decarbonylase, partial [Ilumatobacteraceae bacterium]